MYMSLLTRGDQENCACKSRSETISTLFVVKEYLPVCVKGLHQQVKLAIDPQFRLVDYLDEMHLTVNETSRQKTSCHKINNYFKQITSDSLL